MKKIPSAVGYVRVSTPGQVDNTSLSYQTKVIKNRANADGVNLIKIFSEEGKSGTNTNRPQYQALMDYIDKIFLKAYYAQYKKCYVSRIGNGIFGLKEETIIELYREIEEREKSRMCEEGEVDDGERNEDDGER